MDAQSFLVEFGHIASAPNGPKYLREMIFQLAIRGELVKEDNITWDNYQLVDLGLWGSGGTPLKNYSHYYGGNIPWLVIGDLNDGIISQASATITEEGLKNSSARIVPTGTLLIGMYGSIGKLGITAIQCATNQAIAYCITDNNVVLTEYLFIYIRAIRKNLFLKGQGLAQQNISQKILKSISIKLPHLNFQKKVVAKVDELMALCDKLEAQYQEQAKIEMAARKAVLQDLIGADVVSMSGSLERLVKNLHNLFRTPDSVDDFLVSLKELAVRGLLTTASAEIPDVDQIKLACSTLRAEYVTTGWMRKQKIVFESNSIVDYPPNWAVMPFDEVAVVIGGVTKGRNLQGRDVVTCPYLSVANVQRGFFKLETIKTIDIVVGELGKYQIQDGDLLITEGGDWDKVGRTAIWRGSIENCLHQNHVFKARIPSDQLLNKWVELVFNSNIGRDYFAGASKQTTNLASINMTQLRGFALPIPTLAEQKGILAKLSALSEICLVWRNQLVQARKLSSLLAVASVNRLTDMRSEVQETECLI